MSGDQPIIAEIGATYARACGTLVSSPAGLWVLARALIRAGHDPARPIATIEDGAVVSHGTLGQVAAWSAPEHAETAESGPSMRPSGVASPRYPRQLKPLLRLRYDPPESMPRVRIKAP